MSLRTLALIFILAPLASVAFGFQEGNDSATRAVKGVVTGADSRPVDGAVVQLSDTRTLQIRSFVTKADGAYHFAGLSTNSPYEIHAEHNGATSGTKRLDVYNQHAVVTINLKLNK
ncbi:MAG TPA: carboxypeptidase-like regulatory domain-containing protein [Bryobacteraceae bacterium]|nr:carboxypeptidase-like regulatory domain-containing protein [Bryobacteraceae bacterium]